MNFFQALVLSVVEGLTEFLPVSSTGHMIIASSLMGIEQDAFVKMFTVAIQFGAILSVVIVYGKRFLDFRNFDFYFKLLIAFIPAAVAGLLFKKHIDLWLEKVWVVGLMLLLGGIFLLFVDKLFRGVAEGVGREVKYRSAFEIGCFQVMAMVPGVSRSAATIVGGMVCGLNRKQAAEFSFFLAVPTMFAATVKSMYDLYKSHPELYTTDHLGLLLLGNVVAFFVALLAIKSFISWLQRRGFRVFGWYRVILGSVILLGYVLGYEWIIPE